MFHPRAHHKQQEALQLWDRFAALKAEEETGVLSSEATRMTNSEPRRITWRKWQVIAVGSSLLQGIEALTCQPDLLSKEFCCFLGAWIQDVVERLLKLVPPSITPCSSPMWA